MSQLAQFIGQRIRSQRKSQGLTQEQLGEKVGIPQSYIGSIERGQTVIQIDTLERILIALKLEPTDLFQFYKGTEPPERGEKTKLITSLQEMLLTRDIAEIKLVYGFARDILKTIEMYKK